MIRVGIAGIGFMGMTHYLAYQKIRGAKVVALCEQDEKRLAGDWRSIKGNFGEPGKKMDLSGIDRYRDLDKMIADPKIDMIDVCLPPTFHADVTVKALKAGKHVFCEKPIAMRPADGKRMVAAAQKAKRQLMVGQVLPFFPEYQYAYKTVTSGKYGKLLGGHFKRITADPLWIKDFYDADRVGGPMIDLHIHDAHFIRLLCGMPTSVFGTGRMRGDVAEFFTTQFRFADPSVSVTATSGAIFQQGRTFTHGYEIHMEKATLLFDLSVIDGKPELNMPVTLLPSNNRVVRPKIDSGDVIDAFVNELKEAVRVVRTGKPSPLLDSELARDALIICGKETQSIRTGRIVKI